ncbi:nucleotidyltransferase family protein [Pedobacter sp. PWIIR3]
MSTGIIILAAGSSSRLGKPKQLLVFRGKTLLQNVSNTALNTSCRPIVVVLGAYAEEISKIHHHPDITYVVNHNWQEGMSSSIATGISEMLHQQPDLEDIIITVADQAFIDSQIFDGLLQRRIQTSKTIIACQYGDTIGTPVLFNKTLYHQLLALTGDQGAKKIIAAQPDQLSLIEFPLGHIDIDTAEDFSKLA